MPDGDDETDQTPVEGTLVIEPAASEHELFNGAPATQAFTAKLVLPDGTEQDVTADTTFFIDNGIGAFSASTLTMGGAGKGTVTGSTAGGDIGTAQVIVRVRGERVDPSLPPTVPQLFSTGTEDAAQAPNVVYPPIGVVVPRNLGDFEVHWTDDHAHDVFEVSIKTDYTDVRVYVPGNNGNPAAGSRASWVSFLAAEWLSAVGNSEQVLYQVRGASTAAPGTIGVAAPRTVTLTTDGLEGGVYYWAAASGTLPEGIYRHDFAQPGQPAEEFLTRTQTNGRCVACHVLSRDGTRMAITYDGGGRPTALVDVATRERTGDLENWNFGTFGPTDSNLFLGVSDGIITVRNATDGTLLGTMESTGRVSQPDLSADGTLLTYTYTRIDNVRSDWDVTESQIYVRSFDPVTRGFGPETPVVTDGGNNFYPSLSPDGEWIMFNRSAAGTSYNNRDASLWVVNVANPTIKVELSQANLAANGLTNSWGRWAPFDQAIGTGESLFWITVSSTRDFGVRIVQSALPTRQPQIWMTPFFPGRAAAGMDPTTPAFWLPFQSIQSNNHIAQWTERVVILQ